MPGAIYSIGVEGLSVERLERLVQSLDLLVIDVRDDTSAAGFGYANLAGSSFCAWYEHRRSLTSLLLEADPDGGALALLALQDTATDYSVLLLGELAAPAECHRHTRIATELLRLGLDCVHVYGHELIRASELQRALDEDRDYECFELPKDLW